MLKEQGFSLLETIVSSSLLCVLLLLSAGIIPYSFKAVKKAEYYHIASGYALKLLSLSAESPLPKELDTVSVYPAVSAADAASIFEHPAHCLTFSISPDSLEKSVNPGVYTFKSGCCEIVFFYFIKYRRVEQRDECRDLLNFFLVDISCDVIWDDSNPSSPDLKQSKNLRKVSYVQRVLKEKE